MNNQPQDNNSLLADSITKALAYTENGGKPDINNPKTGKTGEAKSIFQYTPETWKARAKKFLGDENAPITADNETYVTREFIKKELEAGKSTSQIASMWNAGEGEPDAYTGKFSNGNPSTGVNKKYGVKYDVPGYAKKVEEYTKQFLFEKSHQAASGQGNMPTMGSATPDGGSTQVPDPSSDATMKTTTSPSPKATNMGLIKKLIPKQEN